MKDETSAICFILNSQKAIQLRRNGLMNDFKACAKATFKMFGSLKKYYDLVKDVGALFGYRHADKSCVRYLFEDAQRELVAKAVDTSILSTNAELKDSLHSSLERVLMQLTACLSELELANGSQGLENLWFRANALILNR